MDWFLHDRDLRMKYWFEIVQFSGLQSLQNWTDYRECNAMIHKTLI